MGQRNGIVIHPIVNLTESEPLSAWWAKHADHGRCGPWPDAKLHIYHTWRCPCGEKWQCTDEEIKQYPERCTPVRQ